MARHPRPLTAIGIALCWAVWLGASAPALAAPGEVLSYQKISSTTGGLVGPLADSDRFGSSAAAIGDLDGDGVEDLAVGASNVGASGAVWILFLDVDGTVQSEVKLDESIAPLATHLQPDDGFGTRIELLGDLDRDGNVELAVGAFGDDEAASSAGAVYILSLDPSANVVGVQKITAGVGGFVGPLSSADQWSSPGRVALVSPVSGLT